MTITVAQAVKAAYDCYHTPPTLVGEGENSNIQVVIFEGDPVQVAFPGSIELRDWMLDFMAMPHPVANHPELGRVHEGFLIAALSVAPQIARRIGDRDYVTLGHSLGGALALLTPGIMPRRPSAIFAFAPPRVFADQVPDWIVQITQAWRYGNDIVPDVPGNFPHVPVWPIGRSMEIPTNCHHIENYVSALS